MMAGGALLMAQAVEQSLSLAENATDPLSDGVLTSELLDHSQNSQGLNSSSYVLQNSKRGRYAMYDDEYGETRHDGSFGNPDKMKYVDFEIRFAKPDHQALLREVSGFPVNYATDSNSFSALRLGDFIDDLRDGLPIPAAWRGGNHPKGDYGYQPNDKKPVTYSKVPEKDKKHIEVKVKRVDDSTELKEATEVDAIREVRDEVKGVKEAIEKMWD
jgi:hypothetical protein